MLHRLMELYQNSNLCHARFLLRVLGLLSLNLHFRHVLCRIGCLLVNDIYVCVAILHVHDWSMSLCFSSGGLSDWRAELWKVPSLQDSSYKVWNSHELSLIQCHVFLRPNTFQHHDRYSSVKICLTSSPDSFVYSYLLWLHLGMATWHYKRTWRI